jgi:hypothetical protein
MFPVQRVLRAMLLSACVLLSAHALCAQEDSQQVYPLPPLSPTDPQQCQAYGAQIGQIAQVWGAKHDACLTTYAKDPSAETGGDILICSKPECQTIHDVVYGSQFKEAQSRLDNCNKQVASYQQAQEQFREQQEKYKEEQQRKAAEQYAAIQAAQARAQAQRSQQIANQRAAAQQRADAMARTQAQLQANEAAAQAKVDAYQQMATLGLQLFSAWHNRHHSDDDGGGGSSGFSSGLPPAATPEADQLPTFDPNAAGDSNAPADAPASAAPADETVTTASPSAEVVHEVLPPDPTPPPTEVPGLSTAQVTAPPATQDDDHDQKVRQLTAEKQAYDDKEMDDRIFAKLDEAYPTPAKSDVKLDFHDPDDDPPQWYSSGSETIIKMKQWVNDQVTTATMPIQRAWKDFNQTKGCRDQNVRDDNGNVSDTRTLGACFSMTNLIFNNGDPP